MPAYLEAWIGPQPDVIALEGAKLSIGKAATNDVTIPEDATVSRVHAILELLGGHWSVRDVGSRNGTFVNGERIVGDRLLRHGDEIRFGATRAVFHSRESAAATATEAAQPPPEITRMERAVLIELCRPVFSGNILTEPSPVRKIAAELTLTESTVKKHLLRLYDKFLIPEGEGRRGLLANEAMRRGAVTLAELKHARRD